MIFVFLLPACSINDASTADENGGEALRLNDADFKDPAKLIGKRVNFGDISSLDLISQGAISDGCKTSFLSALGAGSKLTSPGLDGDIQVNPFALNAQCIQQITAAPRCHDEMLDFSTVAAGNILLSGRVNFEQQALKLSQVLASQGIQFSCRKSTQPGKESFNPELDCKKRLVFGSDKPAFLGTVTGVRPQTLTGLQLPIVSMGPGGIPIVTNQLAIAIGQQDQELFATSFQKSAAAAHVVYDCEPSKTRQAKAMKLCEDGKFVREDEPCPEDAPPKEEPKIKVDDVNKFLVAGNNTGGVLKWVVGGAAATAVVGIAAYMLLTSKRTQTGAGVPQTRGDNLAQAERIIREGAPECADAILNRKDTLPGVIEQIPCAAIIQAWEQTVDGARTIVELQATVERYKKEKGDAARAGLEGRPKDPSQAKLWGDQANGDIQVTATVTTTK